MPAVRAYYLRHQLLAPRVCLYLALAHFFTRPGHPLAGDRQNMSRSYCAILCYGALGSNLQLPEDFGAFRSVLLEGNKALGFQVVKFRDPPLNTYLATRWNGGGFGRCCRPWQSTTLCC